MVFCKSVWIQTITCCLLVSVTCVHAKTREYILNLSNEDVSPDGGLPRRAVLTNGKLGGPMIEVAVNDVLRVTVNNSMMAYDPYFGQVTVHWHGFSMKGVPYMDGTGQMSQCPIPQNSSMVYEFQVRELPGSYMYHGHNTVLVADGLAGGLIVSSGKEDGSDEDIALILSEWFSEPGPVLAKLLNRPFVAQNDIKNSSDLFQWVGTPRSLLLNYQGCHKDCVLGKNQTKQDCSPDPGCETRYRVTVKRNSSYRIRLIGAGSLLEQMVCFEGHNLTLVATDARKTQPLDIGECVDVNLGQRMDVILNTKGDSNQTMFWITGRALGRTGMPASYGVLQYEDGATGLPPSAAPQPADVPISWTTNDFVMNITSPVESIPEYVSSEKPGKRVIIEVAQPILQQTAQLRWALSNVAYLETPSCNNTLAQAQDPEWLSPSNPYVIDSAEEVARLNASDIPGLGQDQGSGDSFVFLNLNFNKSLMPKEPVAGTPIIEIESGQVIDVLLQNNPAQAFGGILLNRTNQEEHPIHLHGHHFYVIGSGQGDFVELEKNGTLKSLLNYKNPRLADTATLPQDGWLYLRFKAGNPGVWPIHCHIAWHEFMGQLSLFAEDVKNIPKTPEGVLPECPSECQYAAGSFTQAAAAQGGGTAPPAASAAVMSQIPIMAWMFLARILSHYMSV